MTIDECVDESIRRAWASIPSGIPIREGMHLFRERVIHELHVLLVDQENEDAAKIAREVAEDEKQRAHTSPLKGDHAKFQSQSYIDGAIEVEERIKARAKEVGK